MNEEKLMTEKESMELITSMINKAKSRFHESGFLYLLWGWVVLICCMVEFIAAYFFDIQMPITFGTLRGWCLYIKYFFCERKEKCERTQLTLRI